MEGPGSSPATFRTTWQSTPVPAHEAPACNAQSSLPGTGRDHDTHDEGLQCRRQEPAEESGAEQCDRGGSEQQRRDEEVAPHRRQKSDSGPEGQPGTMPRPRAGPALALVAPAQRAWSARQRGAGGPEVLQVTCKRKARDRHAPAQRRRWRTVTVYAVTNLPHAQAGPARLADLLRGHWAIGVAT
jgi:hypothetical protein